MIESPYSAYAPSLTGPLSRAVTVLPDDNTDLTFQTRAVLLGTGGDLAVMTAHGDTLTLAGLKSGVLYPLALHRIQATGTTATGIVGLA